MKKFSLLLILLMRSQNHGLIRIDALLVRNALFCAICALFSTITYAADNTLYATFSLHNHNNRKPFTHPSHNRAAIRQYVKHTHHYSSSISSLLTCSSHQLASYFAHHGYTQNMILAQSMLYMSDEFVTLAKTYPGYELAIVALRKKIRGMSSFGKWWRERITGSYSTQLEARINQLYAEIHHQQPPAVTSQASHNDAYEHTIAHLCDEWAQCAAISYDQKIKERLNKRIHALDQHHTTSCGPPHKNAYIFAQQHHIDLHEFAPNNDSAIAHILYQEYVDILGAAAHIPAQNTEILCTALGEASYIGLEANKAGFVAQASKLADFCWTVLDYAQAVGEGIYLGTTDTLHTLAHPVETVTNALIGIGVITYGLVNLTDFVQHAPFLYVIHNDQFFLRLNTIQDQLQTIADAATTYLTSNEPRNIVKDGTAFITEGLLFGKIVSFAANLTKQILPLAMHYAEYIAAEEPLACLADGEMIFIEISKDIPKSNAQPLLKYAAVDAEKTLYKVGQAAEEVIMDTVNQTCEAILKNGYYEVNGFRFSEFYYNKLWNSGRKAPTFMAKEILEFAKNCIPDIKKKGFFRYEFADWEMIYNPTTKEVWHLQPIKKG